MTKRQIDWEKIELDYRAGIMSIREIASKHGITDTAIRKKAKAQDWVRDVSAKIQAKADKLVRIQEVRKEVRNSQQYKQTEKQLIDKNAQIIADIRLSHRKDFVRFKKTIEELQSELDELNALKDPDNLVTRTKVLKDLTDTHAKLVSLERQAYNMDKEVVQTIDPLTELITTITKTNKSTFGVVSDDPEYEQ